MSTIPFIDIFAGPGGLSEGFSRFASFTGAPTKFESRLAIEKVSVAAQTLRLRSFYRAFPKGAAPDEYYEAIRGQRPIGALALFPQWAAAESHVWNATLGEVDEKDLHDRIDEVLNGNPNWVLLGGPPCQAYGKARVGIFVRCQDTYFSELRELGWPSGSVEFGEGKLLNRVTIRPIAWLANPVSGWAPAHVHSEFILPLALLRGDIRSNFVERTRMVSRPVLAQALVRIMAAEPWITSVEGHFREFMKVVNRNGGGILFEVLGPKETDQFLEACKVQAMEHVNAREPVA